MDYEPLVSIIIPTYNRSYILQNSINSALNQTYQNIEVLIIDDYSNDDTENKVKSISDERLKYHKNKFVKGAPGARNYGLKIAKGELIQFLDSDDLLKKEKIEKQVKVFEEQNADIVVCDYERSENNSRVRFSNENPYQKVMNTGSLHIMAPIFKSEIAKKIKWDIKLKKNQDMDYILKSFLVTNNVRYVNESLCIYNFHNDVQISDKYENLKSTYWRRLLNMYKFMNSNDVDVKMLILSKLSLIMMYKEIKNRAGYFKRRIVSKIVEKGNN